MKKPTNQIAEVLYELMHKPMSHRQFVINNGILCVTAKIANLRAMGFEIPCREMAAKNKYGRRISYGVWTLTDNDRDLAATMYGRINNDALAAALTRGKEKGVI
jgi:hypothetical protein